MGGKLGLFRLGNFCFFFPVYSYGVTGFSGKNQALWENNLGNIFYFFILTNENRRYIYGNGLLIPQFIGGGNLGGGKKGGGGQTWWFFEN